MKKKHILCYMLVLFTLCCFFIYCNYYVLYNIKTQDEKIGIIDEYLSTKYTNVFYDGTIYNTTSQLTHGDQLINFLNDISYTGEIYYFPAIDANNKISTSKIIEGLNWMYQHNINKVNMSLSSKKYDKNLQNWIKEHKEMKIYASYNNQINSFDYPAMYEGVIASGTHSEIEYKKNDIQYRTHYILTIHNGIHYYNGNSFLSLITLLK